MLKNEKILTWIKLEDSVSEIPATGKEIHQYIIEGKKICFTIYNDELKAFAATCPHAGGMLVHSRRDVAGNIICPLHGYKFNPSNGRNISGEGYFLKTYPLEKREDGIYIGL